MMVFNGITISNNDVEKMCDILSTSAKMKIFSTKKCQKKFINNNIVVPIVIPLLGGTIYILSDQFIIDFTIYMNFMEL